MLSKGNPIIRDAHGYGNERDVAVGGDALRVILVTREARIVRVLAAPTIRTVAVPRCAVLPSRAQPIRQAVLRGVPQSRLDTARARLGSALRKGHSRALVAVEALRAACRIFFAVGIILCRKGCARCTWW